MQALQVRHSCYNTTNIYGNVKISTREKYIKSVINLKPLQAIMIFTTNLRVETRLSLAMEMVENAKKTCLCGWMYTKL